MLSAESGMINSTKQGQVNQWIKEYLVAYDYKSTSTSLDRESVARGITLSVLHPVKSPVTHKLTTQFMHAFREGDQTLFFALWDDHFSENMIKLDPHIQRLEFLVSVYFAVYPILPNVSKSKLYSVHATMDTFKHFLETRGASLSKSPQFLQYYALPYVPDPREHPSFSELFKVGWVPEVEEKLKYFLGKNLNEIPKPRLVAMLEEFDGKPKVNSDDQVASLMIKKMKAEVQDMEVVRDQTNGKLRHLQSDYHNLITVASELVQTLAASISGKKITPGYLSTIVSKLTLLKKDANKDSVPTPISKMISLPIPTPEPVRQKMVSPLPPKSSSNQNHYQNSNQVHSNQVDVKRRVSPPLSPLERLDYPKMKIVLKSTPTSVEEERNVAFLIQALRMSLSRSETATDRRHILSLFISNDLLETKGDNLVVALLSSSSRIIRDQVSRLVNTMATDCAGREHLLGSDASIISTLVSAMKSEKQDSDYRQNLLGTLQKLSLRRMAQSAMNRLDVVIYLQDLLEDLDGLSEYTIEYGSALLMNLCLRTLGKATCATAPSRTLKILNELIEHDNLQVKTYVNGILYSILSDEKIREHARSIGMEDQLKYLKEHSDEQLVKQIDFVIERLNSDEEDEDASDTVSEDGEEEDNLDEEDEAILEDEDSEEIYPNVVEKAGMELLLTFVGQSPSSSVPQPQHSQPKKNNALALLERSLSRLASQHDLSRAKTPSRPTTPHLHNQKKMTLVVGPPPEPKELSPKSPSEGSKESLGDLTGKPTIDQLRALAAQVQQMSLKKEVAKSPTKVPTTRDEIEEFELAFSTRPKLPRTPTSDMDVASVSSNNPWNDTRRQGANSIGQLADRLASRSTSRMN